MASTSSALPTRATSPHQRPTLSVDSLGTPEGSPEEAIGVLVTLNGQARAFHKAAHPSVAPKASTSKAEACTGAWTTPLQARHVVITERLRLDNSLANRREMIPHASGVYGVPSGRKARAPGICVLSIMKCCGEFLSLPSNYIGTDKQTNTETNTQLHEHFFQPHLYVDQ